MVLCLLALTACALAAPPRARDYYVSPHGDDANPGTQALPWRSVAQAGQITLNPGDRLLFEGGQTFVGNIRLDAKCSGTPEQYVTIGSYGTGRASIDAGQGSGLEAQSCDYLLVQGIDFVGAGRNRGNNGVGVHITSAKGPKVDEVDVQGFRLAGIKMQRVSDARITNVFAHDNGAAGISVNSFNKAWSEDVYIGHCVAADNAGDPLDLDNHSGNGIVVGGTRRGLIEYCEAMNNGSDMPRSGNGPVGIWAYNADSIVIQFCVAYDNKSPGYDGGGFDLDGGLTNCILQYNLSFNNDGPGYFCCQYPTAPAWKNNIIRYNISQNDGSKDQQCGIMVMANDHGMSDCEIYNNTVLNTRGAAVEFNGLEVTGFRLRNNILVSATEVVKGDPWTNRLENNLYWMLGGREFAACGYKSLEAWRDATGQERQGDKPLGLYADPRLILPGSARCIKPVDLVHLRAYKLEPESPCIGAGVPVENSGGRDFWGAPVNEERPTIGASEITK